MRDLFDGLDVPTPIEQLPAQRHSPTSVAAAERAEPAAATQRRAVLDYLRGRGADGAIDEEIQVALGMVGNTERPRRRECEQAGLIVDSGRTRPTASGRQAVVWVPTEGAK